MALANVCAAIVERLRLIPGVVQAPDAPPSQLVEDRMLIVYPMPGASTPMAHNGRDRQAVIQNRDNVIVEWHFKVAADQVAAFLGIATPLIDQIRDTIWSEFLRNRFGGTVDLLYAVNTDQFGEMGWGTDFTYGFRMNLDLLHGTSISAGRA